MKKVLLISNNNLSANGGIQTYRKYLIKVLQKKNIQVDYLYKDKKEIKEFENVKFINLLNQFKAPVFINIIFNMFNILTKKYDAILITHINYVIFAPFLKVFQKRKIILFVYGIDGLNLSFFKRFYSNFCDLVITHSEFTKFNFLSNFKRFKKLIVSIGGPYLNNKIYKHKIINSKKLIKITSVTRIEKSDSYKNLDKIIDILKYLKNKKIKFQYNLIGEGDDLNRLKKNIKINKLEKYVVIHGWLDENSKNEILKKTDIYLLPSDGEGFGLSFIEAANYGALTIGSVTDGSREALGFGKYGYLINPNDINLPENIYKIIKKKQEFKIDKLNKDFSFQTFQNKIMHCINFKDNDIIICRYDNNKNKIQSINNVAEGLACNIFWKTGYNIKYFYQITNNIKFIDIFFKYLITSLNIFLLNFKKNKFLIFTDQGLSIYSFFYFKKKILMCHDVLNQMILKKYIKTTFTLKNSFIYKFILLGLKNVKIISSSVSTKKNLIKLGINQKNILYQIDPIFHLTKEKRFYQDRILINNLSLNQKNKEYITLITTNSWYKRDDEIYSLIENLSEKNQDLVFNIISLNKTFPIKRLNKFKNINLFFGVSDFDKNLILSKSNFLIHNADYEGYGLPILEALKYSLIVFTKNTQHYKYIYKKNIYYYEADNTSIITETINNLTKNKKKLLTAKNKSFITYKKIMTKFSRNFNFFLNREII